MQTKKEALLALLHGEKADFIPEVMTTMKDVVFPGERYIELGDKFEPYGTGPDAWGVLWTNRGPDPMIDGNMVAKDFRLSIGIMAVSTCPKDTLEASADFTSG